MKKIKLLSLVLTLTAIAGLSACQEIEPGATAVESMCGEWVAYSPDFDLSFALKTSNTSNNEANKIIVTDRNAAGTNTGFWGFTVRADCDAAAKTFACTNVINEYWTETNGVYTPYEIKVTIRNGKITEGAIELPSGVKADKIEFEIWFEDIEDAGAPADYYCSIFGYRKSGFFEDDDFIYTGE
ncbi:MAG: hypothetical protein LBB84_07015 [Tannerellaceae bacterium]|jgi:hypothetical protein|nr:hypothetical protein [Tannerellaceae bacterium]